MTPALGYARAILRTGNGVPSFVVTSSAMGGAALMFVPTMSFQGIQVFGGAALAGLPALLAQGSQTIPGRPSAVPLPALPVTTLDRMFATVGVASLHMVPSALVVAAVSGDPAFVAGRVAAAVSFLILSLSALRLADLRGSSPESTQFWSAMPLAFLLIVPALCTAWALLPAAIAVVLVFRADRTPGVPSGQIPSTRPYAPHRLDEAPDARPLFHAAQADARRLGLRDGVVTGLAAVALLGCVEVLRGDNPVGDLEELRAAMAWGLADRYAAILAFDVLGMLSLIVCMRSIALPGHSSDAALQGNELSPLRWLPVRRGQVWRDAAWVVVQGWIALWAGATVPLAIGLVWVGGAQPIELVLPAATGLFAGLAAVLLVTQHRALRAYDRGPQSQDNQRLFLAIVPMATSLFAIPAFISVFSLIFPVVRGFPPLAGHTAAFALSATFFAAVATLFYRGATREQA